MSLNGKIRVLVVDDSALMRKLIPQVLHRDPNIEVVGTAMDGEMGLKKIAELHPHVVTLDLDMPRMDGIEMLRQITRKHHVPVIVFSAQTDRSASDHLEGSGPRRFRLCHQASRCRFGSHRAYCRRICTENKSGRRFGRSEDDYHGALCRSAESASRSAMPNWPSRIVAIGISTGGPNALQYLFSQLPEDFPGCLLVVQHMPEGFTDMFARRLHESSAIEVKEAQSGDLLLAGRALICPGNRHMKVRRMEHGNIAVLVDQPRVNGHRPSVDVLFQSVAQEFGSNAIAVLMTGMGDDGAAGLGAVRSAGGLTIVQSPDSCVVDSMPRSAIERGFASRVVSLSNLSGVLQSKCAVERAPAEPVPARIIGGSD